MKKASSVILAVIAALATAACGAGMGVGDPPSPRAGAGGRTRVFLILMENKNWEDVKGSESAPYINSLLSQGAHAEQYYNPPDLHPSEPNYLWLEAGTSFGVVDDALPADNHQRTKDHLVTLLERAGRSWKAYEEGIGGRDCPLVDVDDYAPKHCAMVFFDDVTDTNSPTAPRCVAHVRPYAELAADLANDTVPDYSFITPDLCHDMHDTCPPLYDSLAQGDAWLSAELPKILASRAYEEGAVVLLTWDEGEDALDGPIGLIALSKHAKAGYSNAIHYTHSSTLRTVEELLGVGPLLGDAANANDLSDLFVDLP